MFGHRTKIVLLTAFFTFAFTLLFLVLMQNVQASSPSSSPIRIVAVVDSSDLDIESAVQHDIVPDFGVQHQSPTFDFDSDDSLQKYLHTDHPFDNTSYIPQDLVYVDSDFIANTSKIFKLREEAALEFADMAWHFWDTFSGDKLYIVSAYRSKKLQDYLIEQWCSLLKCAKIGTSEHQAGLAVDLRVITKWWKWYSLDLARPNKYYDRLKNNAAQFWFHNTYQKGIEIDGKIVEWRHRRYLWTELATILADNQQTFAEYYNLTNN